MKKFNIGSTGKLGTKFLNYSIKNQYQFIVNLL